MGGICVHDDSQGRARPARRGHGARRRIATVGVTLGVVVAGAVGTGAVARPARASTPNRAAVVVEVNGVLHTAKITFAGTSISGLDALRSAGFDPSVRVFGGNGGALCALAVGGATIGCPADGTCLTCAAPDYWSYWRAPAGATRYTYSVAGAGNTQVHDGDVEAWAWGTGSAPSPFVSFAEVWGPDPTTTRPPGTSPPTTRRSSPSTARTTAPATVGGLGTATTVVTPQTAPPSSGAAPTVAPPATTMRPRSSTTSPVTTGVLPAATHGGAGRRLATAPVVAHGGGSSSGLAGFAVILLGLLGAIVVARRRRASNAAR